MSSHPSPSPSPSAHSDEEKPTSPTPPKSDLLSPPPAPPRNHAFPGREDCWSEEATRTVIDAWGAHYLDLNRGNLRQKHWQEVADAVNSVYNLRRSDVQCKNRIDTTKKKFKIEKSKVAQSNGRYVSSWPHFQTLDALIGNSFCKPPTTNTKPLRRRNSPPPPIRREDPLRLTWTVPVGPRSKRSGAGSVTERNFSVMAAAAAAIEAEEDEDDDDSDRRAAPSVWTKRKATAAADEEREGYRMLAAAIMRLGQIYERVEVAKLRQMVEFEKQRMQFAKDLEILRAQIQFDNLKRAKCTSKNCSFL